MHETATSSFYAPGYMDLSRYTLERTEPGNDWDHLVEASPDGTIFSLSAFLEEMPAKPGLWQCRKGNQLAGIVALAERDDAPDQTMHVPHVIHNGIMTLGNGSRQNIAQQLSEQFRTIAASFSMLSGIYQALCFTTPPSFADMRPILWHNYGNSGPKPELELRYTSTVALHKVPEGEALEHSELYRQCNKSRRQAVRYALDAGITISETSDIEIFLDLYQRTFQRQGISLDTSEILFLRRLCARLAQSGRLRVFVACTQDGKPGSVAVFGVDRKRAYYLYGANEPDLRTDHCGTMALFHAMRVLGQEGIPAVDLEGVNSPKRGYFKLSFGGDLSPYYRVRLSQ
jgi:hypothetical protein